MRKTISVARGDCGCSALPADKTDLVELRPSEFSSLFGDDFGDEFLLVTSTMIRDSLEVVNDLPDSCPLTEFCWEGEQPRRALVDRFRHYQQQGRRCSVLWIGDDEFQHYLPAQIRGIKVAGISFFSSYFASESLLRFIQIVSETDYQRELRTEEEFLDLIQNSERMIFRSERFGTEAVFEHHEAEHWFSMHGPLDFGQQTVLPTGELATLTDASGDFDFHSRFNINGQLVLMGQPVVHRGNREVSREETSRQYNALAVMRDQAVILDVEGGFVREFRAANGANNDLYEEIRRIFKDDEQYRKIHEVGFGTHPGCDPLFPANFFPNERFPGIHFGFGLGGATSFHLDLVCTEESVICQDKDGREVDLYQRLEETWKV